MVILFCFIIAPTSLLGFVFVFLLQLYFFQIQKKHDAFN